MKKSKTPKTFLMVHNDRDITLAVYESYATISRRLVEVGDFFEATTPQGKEMFSKRTIVRVGKLAQVEAPKVSTEAGNNEPKAPHHVPANNIGTIEPQ